MTPKERVALLEGVLAEIEMAADVIGDSDSAWIYVDRLDDIWKMANEARTKEVS
jgi:hypothetical protein